jgi:hypothetical protein
MGGCGAASELRWRLTKAQEELATYIDGWESKRLSTAPSLARMEY